MFLEGIEIKLLNKLSLKFNFVMTKILYFPEVLTLSILAGLAKQASTLFL